MEKMKEKQAEKQKMAIVESDSCTTNPCEYPAYIGKFTPAALRELSQAAPGKVVTFEYDAGDICGTVISSRIEGGKMIVKANIFDDYFNLGRNIVPKFLVKKLNAPEKGDPPVELFVCGAVELVGFGLTANPLEKDALRQMKKVRK